MDPIKLYAEHVIEKSQLKTSDKIYLQNRLQKGTLYETMAFLNKGQMLNESVELNEEFNKKIEEDFWANEKLQESIEKYILDEAFNPSPGGQVIMGIYVLASTWFAWRKLRGWFDDNFRKCGTFRIGKDRKACHKNLRIEYNQKRINLLKKNKCEKANDPNKCRKLVKDRISKYVRSIEKDKKTLKRLNLPGNY